MGTHRLMPPNANGNPVTTKVNGRSYTCPANSSIDVPDFDGVLLAQNGWTYAAAGGSGTTAQRPTGLTVLNKGLDFHDNTLGKNILWDGKAWRDPDNGTAV